MGFWLFDSCWRFSLLVGVMFACVLFALGVWCFGGSWQTALAYCLFVLLLIAWCFCCVLVVAFLGESVVCCFGLRLLVTMVLIGLCL